MTAPRREASAGGVVFARIAGTVHYLLIRDAHGNWGFPKGLAEPNESPPATARREVEEETGVTHLTACGPLTRLHWALTRDGTPVEKHCDLFLFETHRQDLVPHLEEGVLEGRWLPYAEARATLTFANARDALTEAEHAVSRRVGAEVR